MKCKICNEEVNSFEDLELSKFYYHCPKCEFIFLDEKFYVKENEEKKQYDQHNNSLENEGYVKMFEDFLNFVLEGKFIKTSLDFGSGPSPVLAELLTKVALHVEYYDKFYQPKKVYKDKKYDLITSTEVFEHLKSPNEILKLFSKHINTDGQIAIMTLFHSNNQKEFLKWWYRRDPTHISFFTPKTMKFLADNQNLKITKCDNKRVIVFEHL
jgi:hypothetical protein